jgi:DHA3 family macrolide efflux protein-like MFS transporter
MLIFGPLADVISVDWLLVGTGAGIIVLGACLMASRTLRQAGWLPEATTEAPNEALTEEAQ